MTSREFLKSALEGFAKLKKELREDMEERDLRESFVRVIVREVLGWEKGKEDGRYEVAEIRDITFYDDKDFPIVIIETKAPSESIEKKDFRNKLEGRLKLFGSEYGVLTNGHKLFLYSYSPDLGMKRKARINIDSLSEKEFIGLSQAEKDGLSEFRKIKRVRLLRIRDTKYLADRHRVIDISTDEGFDQLVAKIRVSLDEIIGAVRKYFNFYSKDDHPQAEFFKKAYDDWCSISNRDKTSADSVETFCRETAYVILNRILFTRILDDKKLIAKAISGKGLAASYESRKKTDNPWMTIFKGACKDAEEYYEHFYMLGMFDWWEIEETKRELLDRQQESELEDSEAELNEAIGESFKLLNPFNFEPVDRDILGHIYQQYLPPEERKELGEFYTPIEVVKYILDSVGFKPENKIENKQLLDPACGSGTFLVEAVNRLLKRYKKKGLNFDKPEDTKIALEGIVEHINGLDINPFACHIAEMNLLFQIIELYEMVRQTDKFKDYVFPRFNIFSTDSLISPEEEVELSLHDFEQYNSRAKMFLEERKEANKIKNRKFDYVVGNPPWVNIKHIEDEMEEEYRRNSETALGRVDLYILFLERGIKWMNDNGKLGYITSNKFIKSRYGRNLRKFILNKSNLLQFIDFGDTDIFEEATNYPCILVLAKVEHAEEILFANVFSGESKDVLNEINSHIGEKNYFTDKIEIGTISEEYLDRGDNWEFITERERSILENLRNTASNLANNVLGIRQGISSACDDVYVFDSSVKEKYDLEDKLVHPICGGSCVKRWKINWEGNFTIYPYNENGNLIDITNYPNIHNYLEDHKSELKDRYCVEKKGRTWYAYDGPRPKSVYEGKSKIVTPDISKQNNFALTGDLTHFKNTCYVINLKNDASPTFILGILNSSLIEFFIKHISPHVRNKYFRYKTDYLKRIPIISPDSKREKNLVNQIENKVEKIGGLIEQSNSLMNRTSNFLNYCDSKGTDKVAWVVESQELDNDSYKTSRARVEKYQDLEEETKYKFILKRGHYVILDNKDLGEYLMKLLERKERITREEFLGLEIPTEKELHKIMEEFQRDKNKIKEIKGEIEKLEEKINNLVYDLYGLDGNEVKIIEDFLKRT